MSIPLSEAIEQAQTAFDSGDYRSVVDACSRIVDQYPYYTAAHRLLGQAYLEQGQSHDAEASFARVLAHDPREASAYLGLGLIAEERGVLEHALAYCQVAWELAPNQSHFREPVTRVAEKRFGGEGRLRLTHAALAQVHAAAWRLRRAAREYQTALTALPDRVDLWIGLAETLWHLGDDADAAEISREFLKEHPDLVQALVILADIEYRNGNHDEAGRFLERLRAVDPDGGRVRAMVEANPRASAAFLMVGDEQVPTLADRGDVVVSERPMIAPAPDFTYQPDEDDDPAEFDIDELEPIALEEFEDEPVEEPPAEPVETPVEEPAIEPEPEQVEFDDLEAELQEMEPSPPEEIEQEPGNILLEEAIEDSETAEEPLAQADEEDDLVTALESAEAGLDDLLAEFEGIEPMSFEEFGAVEGMVTESGPGFFEDAEIDFDMRIDDPDAVQIGGGLPPATAPGAFAAEAGPGSPAGGNAEEFPEFPDVEEPEQPAEAGVADAETVILDEADDLVVEADPKLVESPTELDLEAEQPDEAPTEETVAPEVEVPSGTGYTTLIGELGSAGLAPFDPIRTASDAADDLPIMEAPASGEIDEVSLVEGWDEMDEDLAAAIPAEIASTDELLELEKLDLEPFVPEHEEAASEADAGQILAPDTADEPESVEAEADSAPEPSEPEPEPVHEEVVAESDEEEVDQAALATTGFTDILGGIEPFAMDEFDELVDDDEPFSFGSLPWEQEEAASALPSDADLEAMLDGDDVGAQAGPATRDDMVIIEPSEVTAELGPGGAPLAPAPEFGDPVDDFEFSTAVTRELGGGEADPDFARRMAEIEAVANRNLESAQLDDQATQDAPVTPINDEAAQTEAAAGNAPLLRPGTNLLRPGSTLLRRLEPNSLVANEGLFQRSRAAKDEMVAEGIIRGDRELAANDEAPYEQQPEPEIQRGTGFSRNVETLRAALQADPNDEEMRWWLAEALRERGEIHEALTEYRWLIRQAPGRHGAVIDALNGCIDAGVEPELAHRLLADTYRRQGDSAQARHHATLAMAVRRQTRQLHV